MKRLSVLLTSIITLSLMVSVSPPTATAEPNLTGTWEIFATVIGSGWYGDGFVEPIKGEIVYICQTDLNFPYMTPNVYVYSLADPPDPFLGFQQGDLFSFFKQNVGPCDPNNVGLEMITGHVYQNDNKLSGKGMGFDSNADCGGTWSYRFRAKRIGALPESLPPDFSPPWDDCQ